MLELGPPESVPAGGFGRFGSSWRAYQRLCWLCALTSPFTWGLLGVLKASWERSHIRPRTMAVAGVTVRQRWGQDW